MVLSEQNVKVWFIIGTFFSKNKGFWKTLSVHYYRSLWLGKGPHLAAPRLQFQILYPLQVQKKTGALIMCYHFNKAGLSLHYTT